MPSSRSIWVLGAHRSGTSAVAGVLHHLGVDMGTMAPREASHPPSNAVGQFEDERAVALMHKTIGNWRYPSTHIFTDQTVAALHQYVREREAMSPLWGVKSPQLCIIWPNFARAAQEPRVVVVVRNLECVVASLCARDGFPVIVAEQITALYWRALSNCMSIILEHKIPHIQVQYPHLLDEPQRVVGEIADCVYDGLPGPTVNQQQAAIAHVLPELCHHR